MFHWQDWTYTYWNLQLIERWLYVDQDDELLAVPIDRIPAMPEQLSLIVGANVLEANSVADALIRQAKNELPSGTSFCGFSEYTPWTPDSSNPPHYFGMLWVTCLIAYGYPVVEGSFDERVTAVLGRSHNYQCLPQLWQDAAAWTRRRRSAGEPVRELQLPPTTEHRRIIGHSHFLAFPNRRDRIALANVLGESGFVGFEPPLVPVVKALVDAKKAFSNDFQDDLHDFQSRYADGQDPRDNAFWRAVRREAMEPSTSIARQSTASSRTALLFLEDEQMLRPIVGCRVGAVLPEGFESHPSDGLFDWPAYVTGPHCDIEAAWNEAFGRGRVIPLGTRKLIEQGLLALKEYSGGQYGVVAGSDIQGSRRALVAGAIVQDFVEAFAGSAPKPTTQPSVIPDWFEVEGCDVRQVDELPPGLLHVTQLLRTTSPPSVTPIGGLPTANGFLFVPRYLPVIRAVGARTVAIIDEVGQVHPCTQSFESAGDWVIPTSLDRYGRVRIRASWVAPINGHDHERISEASLEFVEHVILDDYRGKPSGHYFVESGSEPEIDIISASEVPLGISTPVSDRSADLLEFDASARFLGPGLGEMSLEPKPGFDWLVVGTKKNPELLVFVGDASRPTAPAQTRTNNKGAVRHWRRGFAARRKVVRLPDGTFVELSHAPEAVRHVYSSYSQHRVTGDHDCPTVLLETQADIDHLATATSEAAWKAVDVIATLASRKSRLTYAEVRNALDVTLGRHDHLEFQQILRGWAESGAIDILRSARVSRFFIAPRAPRFVLVRRGAEIEATLVGLTTSVRRRQLERVLDRFPSLSVDRLLPPNPLQPSTIRLRGDERLVEAVRRDVDIKGSEWLDWPQPTLLPPHLDVSAAKAHLYTSKPPDSYMFHSGWDWDKAGFYRAHRPTSGLCLERRAHADASVIYVVIRDGQVVIWTHSRTWALIEAYAHSQLPPFGAEHGVLTSRGRAPVHLPLPLGRLCVLIGAALPGPTLNVGTTQYTYPFGQRLFGLIQRVVPSTWFSNGP